MVNENWIYPSNLKLETAGQTWKHITGKKKIARITRRKRAWKRQKESERDRKRLWACQIKGECLGNGLQTKRVRAPLYELGEKKSRLCVWETGCSEYSGPWTPGKRAGAGRGLMGREGNWWGGFGGWPVGRLCASSHWVASAQARWHHENVTPKRTRKKDKEQSGLNALPHCFRQILINLICF